MTLTNLHELRRVQPSTESGLYFFRRTKKLEGVALPWLRRRRIQSGNRKSGGTRFSLADPTEGTIECHAVSHASREPRAQKGATEGLK